MNAENETLEVEKKSLQEMVKELVKRNHNLHHEVEELQSLLNSKTDSAPALHHPASHSLTHYPPPPPQVRFENKEKSISLFFLLLLF